MRIIEKTITWIFLLMLVFISVKLIYFWVQFPYSDWIEITIVIFEVVLLILLSLFSKKLGEINSALFWISIVAFFLISRTYWLINVPTLPTSDFQYYLQVAKEVAAGKGLTNEVVLYQNGWGYQLFLGSLFAIFGDSLVLPKITNLLLGLATIPLVFLAAKKVGGIVVGRWSVILFVFWPVQWMFTSVLATEHLALPLGLAGLYFGMNALDHDSIMWIDVILSSLFITLSAIVRPAAIVFLGAIILVAIMRYKAAKQLTKILIMIAVYLVANFAYTASLRAFNFGITPSTSFSLAANFYYGSSLPAKGQWSQDDFNIVSTWNMENALENALPLTWQRLHSYSFNQLVDLFVLKIIEFWGSPHYGLYWSTVAVDQTLPHPRLPINLLNGIQYLFQIFIFIGAAIAIIYIQRSKTSNGLYVVLFSLVLGTILHMIFVVSARYSYLYTPLMIILCAYGMSKMNLNKKPFGKNKAASSAKSMEEYNKQRIELWDFIAKQPDQWTSFNRFYHQRLMEIFKFFVNPGSRILELGCGYGDLLAYLQPKHGVGVDFSKEMITKARERHPDLEFVEGDVHNLNLTEKFDVIILSDLINDLWDVERVFHQLSSYCTPQTRVIVNYYSRAWSPLLALTERLGLSKPQLPQNWFVHEDVVNLLYLTGFEEIHTQQEVLWPLPIKFLDVSFNRFLVKLWPFRLLALTNFTVARPVPGKVNHENQPSVSIIIPARNEAGNIQEILKRVPELSAGSELIFVEGHSTDNTFEEIQMALESTTRQCKLYRQTGEGKADAVRLGFSHALGDVLMILDADLTVPPETLISFYNALVTGKGEFINGVRLVYPMENEAMRLFNLMGNKFFSVVFSWLIGQPIKDTLCGTKVLWKRDYERIAANRSYFGEFDPFGDFDLILGAVKLQMKIIDLPIRYKERQYGTTNIQRWKHGFILLKMVLFAANRIKFI